MDIEARVQSALANYMDAPPMLLDQTRGANAEHLSTPDRLAFAFAWIAAETIVNLRFASSALDALPIFHPEHGWDRFLLTRRVSMSSFAHDPADRFGFLAISGKESPHLVTMSGGPVEALRPILLKAPETLTDRLDRLLPSPGLRGLETDWAWKRKRTFYPRLYEAIADLIVTYPGIVCAREIVVDHLAVRGEFHPLFLHSGGQSELIQYDWVQLQYEDWLVFIRTHGEQAIFESKSGGWQTAPGGVRNESVESLKRRILTWLRIEGDLDRESW